MRLALTLHPDFASDAVTGVEVEAERLGNALSLRYRVSGDISAVVLAPPALPERADELWKHTCFEAFLRSVGEAYYEFNFSPSTRWATYAFDGYRDGMKNADIIRPEIEIRVDAGLLELAVELELSVDLPWQLALSAVIEEKAGRKSYWALAHPPGKADFHHPDSFVCELP